MVSFKTQHGVISVDDWGYQLQGRAGAALNASALANQPHDLIVMDFSSSGLNADRFSRAEIDDIQSGPGGNSVAAAYLSIGEASDFRSYWRDGWTKVPQHWTENSDPKASYPLSGSAPDWLGPTNPDWPESRKVRYWDQDWQDVIFNDKGSGWLDLIVKQGFDAAYLDIIDAYYYWGEEVFADPDFPNAQHHAGDPANLEQAAVRMMRFVVQLTAHARETNPDFFAILQNGAFIMADAGAGHGTLKARFRDAVGAIAVEDTYFRGNKGVNNGFHPDRDTIGILKSDFLDRGIPVFAVDYLNTAARIEKFEAQAIDDGFIPYAAPTRSLDRMGDAVDPGTTPSAGFDHLSGTAAADVIHGLGGADLISGGGSGDRLFGDGGSDIVRGGPGNDTLAGGDGDDELYGGRGKNLLFGGDGADKLVGDADDERLSGGSGNDTLLGGGGSDLLFGKTGADYLAGGNGADSLQGDSGADTLEGGGGNDTLFGGAGNDVLFGGPGADVFVVTRHDGHDRIADFHDGSDRINLRAFDFSSIAEVKDHAVEKNGDVTLMLSGDTQLVIEDMTLARLTGADLLI